MRSEAGFLQCEHGKSIFAFCEPCLRSWRTTREARKVSDLIEAGVLVPDPCTYCDGKGRYLSKLSGRVVSCSRCDGDAGRNRYRVVLPGGETLDG